MFGDRDTDADRIDLWARYGVYADRKVREAEQSDGTFEMPLPFAEWLAEEQRLAGEQDELF